MDIFDVVIDKLTIVGHLDDSMLDSFQNVLDEPHVLIRGVPTSGCVEGKFFGYGYKDSVYFCYDEVNSAAMKKRNFRMEFNPTKITTEQSEWIKSKIIYILSNRGITRLDIAFDCGFDLSTFNFEYKSSLKEHIIRSRDKGLETLYFGSRNSDFFYRIYNKKLEQEKERKTKIRALERKEKQGLFVDYSDPKNEVDSLVYDSEHWWRYEVEVKNASTVEKIVSAGLPLFDGKRIIRHDKSTLKGIDKVMLTGLNADPGLWKELHKNTRTKYRKLQKQLDGVDVTPIFNKKLNEKKPELIGEINSWLNSKSVVSY